MTVFLLGLLRNEMVLFRQSRGFVDVIILVNTIEMSLMLAVSRYRHKKK